MPDNATLAHPILVLNSGSSSLKFAVFRAGPDDMEAVLEGSAEGIGKPQGRIRIRSEGKLACDRGQDLPTQATALELAANAMAEVTRVPPIAIGHRIVHGGPHLRAHQRLTPQVLETLRKATHFAPLHIPVALDLADRARALWPDSAQYGCFDNAFHRTLPPCAACLPLPERYTRDGVVRYGFHGLSYESVLRRLSSDLQPRTVLAHLGNGASLCAVLEGKSIDTTMGLTPTGGIPMGTRSGDLDPGVVLYLMRTEGHDVDSLEKLLNRQSGLAGLAGDGDMQTLLGRAKAADAAAVLAVDIFATAVRKQIGAYAALMGGIDLLVFTGGIGEHSAEMRRRIVAGLGFLGIGPEVPGPGVIVVPTEEERQIARHCRALMRGERTS